MIKNLMHIQGQLIIEKENGEIDHFSVDSAYEGVESFIKSGNNIICLLTWNRETPFDLKRRNVVKIDENCEILWVIEDPLEGYRRQYSDDPRLPAILEWAEKVAFDGIWRLNLPGCGYKGPLEMTGRCVAVTAGSKFFLNEDTGELEFWRVDKD